MLKKFSLFVAVLALVVAPVSHAATLSSFQFDGNSTVKAAPDSTVTGTLRMFVPVNQEVEYVETDIIGDNRAPICHDLTDNVAVAGWQERDLDLQMPIYNNSTFGVKVTPFGIFGTSVANGCDPADALPTAHTFQSILKTSTDVSVGGPSNVPPGILAWIMSLPANIKAALLAAISGQPTPSPTPTATPTPSPTPNPDCTTFKNLSAGTYQGQKSFSVKLLQQFLIGKNLMPLGFDTGYYGSITAGAVLQFQATCK